LALGIDGSTMSASYVSHPATSLRCIWKGFLAAGVPREMTAKR